MQRLTRETALWFGVAFLAALPRLLNLDTLLSNDEARHTLDALSAMQGETSVLQNPLFGFLQLASFTLFGANGFTARIVSAIAGITFCLLPFAWRSEIGRTRALVVSTLLALSPTMWFVSREATGIGFAWLLAFAHLAALRHAHSATAALMLGLLLACGKDALSPLIFVVLVGLLTSILARRDFSRLNLSNFSRRNLALGACAFVIGCTGFFLRPAGLGDVFSGFATWTRELISADNYSLSRLALGFVIVELLVLVFALVGIVLSRSSLATLREPFFWAGIGLFVLAVDRGRTVAHLTPILMCDAYLAAIALNKLLQSLQSEGSWLDTSIAGVSFVLLTFAGLGLRQFAAQSQGGLLTSFLIALILIGGMISACALSYVLGAGLRGTGAALAASLLIYTLGSGYQLTQAQAENPAEPYRVEATSPELEQLAKTVERTAVRATGDPYVLPIGLHVSAPPALKWALRNQFKLESTSDTSGRGALLLPENIKPEASSYIGSRFDVVRSASLDKVNCEESCAPLAKWFAFRELNASAITDSRWVFWLNNELAAKASGQR